MCLGPPLRCSSSGGFGVDLLVEEALRQHEELAVLLSDGVRPHKLELLQRKLVELVLHLPDFGLLEFTDGLPGGELLLGGLAQVRLLAWEDNRALTTSRAGYFGFTDNTNVVERRRRFACRYPFCRGRWHP